MPERSPILLATNERDLTTDYVVRELRRRDAPYLRLNTESLPCWTIAFDEGTTIDGMLARNGEAYRLSTFQAAYYRRPAVPAVPKYDAPGASEYAVVEWSAVARSLWNALEGRWLNSPFAILRAEDKPHQLAIARRAGLPVPATLASNDFDRAVAFAADREVVAKPLRRALVEEADGPGRIIYTTAVGSFSRTDRAAFEQVPLIVQERIDKVEDVRVTVIDDRTYAVAIGSQAHEETSTDWRRGSRTDLRHVPFDLSTDVAERCVRVTRDLGLRFSAIDLVRDREGALHFLEANPNGQWAWVEQVTGLPISAAIVDALQRTDRIT